MTRPPARDLVVPGTARLVTPEPYTVVTVECGGCGHQQEARADARTTQCRECRRRCTVQPADTAWPGNVTPLRRTA